MQQSCVACNSVFLLTKKDLAFYEKVSPVFDGKKFLIPAPSHCPSCRQQRRLAYRNERTLYWRTCDLSGTQLLSIYAPDQPFTVYAPSVWYGDGWDGLQFGRDFDFNRPFFEQFFELHREVPLLAINHQAENENCDYSNLVTRNRDCYFIFAANENESCLYSTYLQRNRDVVDCFFIFESERCYECIDCTGCFNLQYSQYCQNCSDSYLLYNCRACQECFCSVSLSNARFHLFNEPLPEAVYRQKVRDLLCDSNFRQIAHERLRELRSQYPQKCYEGINNEQATGDHIYYSKHIDTCFDCTHLEDCSYCTWLHHGRDCYDCYAWGLSAELGYENHLCGNNFYNLQFCESCWNDVSELRYCRYCVNSSKHLFGCIGLKHKEHCVLNKQYQRVEYEALVSRIIDHMRNTGEWGEFFPVAHSPFAYNESVAQEYFPINPEQTKSRGWRWKDDIPITFGKGTLKWDQLPTDSSPVSETILKEVLTCSACYANFRITSPEFRFYSSMEIPIPRYCFSCRYHARLERRNPRTLWVRACPKCGESMHTSFASDRPELVYCEGCYQVGD